MMSSMSIDPRSAAVRALSNGGLLINDLANRQVVLFDASLAQARVVIDTMGQTRTEHVVPLPRCRSTGRS
jgi:hypothetical protein